ncbi:MAG TPA: hypothetical protein PKN73_02175 [Candidatus Paceibacterota bacterium]|jgi:hypothetical protein|nr:hypothetical protein [Candidatus Paceibacterota bacterium]HOH11455.1 hypothetical protein [Candidatus Paceibacterota bacterium]HOY11004.1 hypothetical protein [Candidatus Paceibacterota bacterium]HPB60548.1 hypothetical protein [Candidatus Paceibacterota bacterium]HPI24686.1 hypothetical protein [Candidatus Paceibacterota bacterium]
MNTKKIVTYVALAVIILIAIFWVVKVFTGEEEPQSGVTMSPSLVSDANQIALADDPFFTLLNGIKDIDLTNLELLSHPIFVNGLQDLSRPVSDRGRGRENPFAQIGAGNLSLGSLDDQDSPTKGVFETATSSEAVVSPEGGSDVTTDDGETADEAAVE